MLDHAGQTTTKPDCSAIDDRIRADETYRKAEFVVREYLTYALRNKPISTLATSEVKPVFEAIASHAPNLATKARQYVGGIVTYAVKNGLHADGAPLIPTYAAFSQPPGFVHCANEFSKPVGARIVLFLHG